MIAQVAYLKGKFFLKFICTGLVNIFSICLVVSFRVSVTSLCTMQFYLESANGILKKSSGNKADILDNYVMLWELLVVQRMAVTT